MDERTFNRIQEEIRLDPRLVKAENLLERRIIKFYDRSKKELLEELKKYRVEDLKEAEELIEYVLQKNEKDFQEIIYKGIETGAKLGALQVVQFDLHRYKYFKKFSLNDIHPDVYTKIRTRKEEWCEKKSKQLNQGIITTLQQGYENGQGIDTIADELTKNYNVEKARARTIARTEINGAKNDVAFHTIQDLGIEKKQWSSSEDMRVRPSHASVNGEIVGINEYFSNGLLYPCDPDGPADEVCNCRCSVLSYIDKETI